MKPVIDFVMSNQAVCAAAVMGLLDLAMALNPKLDSDGIFHAVYLFVKGLVKKDAPPAA